MTINTRIVFSFLTILAVLAAVVGITLAQFSDSATLANNTLSTGDADLKIAQADGGTCESFSGTQVTGVQTSNLAPGQSGNRQFCLRNDSASEISLEISAVTTVDVTSTLEASKITVKVNCNSDNPASDVTLTLDGATSNGPIVTVPHGAVSGNPVLCRITQTLNPTVDNLDAGKDIKYDVVFTGTQAP